MSAIDILLGQGIARQRRLRKISQLELADRLNVSRQRIVDYEQGKRRASAKELFEIAKVIDLEIQDFFSRGNPLVPVVSMPSLPPEAQRLTEHYHTLSKPHRTAIFAFLLAGKDRPEPIRP